MIDYEELWNSEESKIYELYIQADTNDADYVTSIHPVSQKEIDALIPIIEMIKNCKNHYNWATGEYSKEREHPKIIYPELTEQAFEWFAVEYYPLPNKVKLL